MLALGHHRHKGQLAPVAEFAGQTPPSRLCSQAATPSEPGATRR
jgi:hypothetical protein